MKKLDFFALPLMACAALFLGCNTVPKEIPEDLDARQLIQLGQDSFDNVHYKAAELYFNTVLERFGDDPKHYLEAKYELGHLYLRQKKYSAAYDNLKEIEEIYESVPVGLPGSYRILCGIELAKIPEEKIKEFEARDKAAKEEPAPKEEAKQSPKAPEVQETPTVQEPPKEEQKEIEPPESEGSSEVSESANE